jgi:hypothetical protein
MTRIIATQARVLNPLPRPRRSATHRTPVPLLIFAAFLLIATIQARAENPFCADVMDHGEPTGYRVVGYEAATMTWTILRNGTFSGKYLVKRMVVRCSARDYGDGQLLRGQYCGLQVGRLYHWYKACDNGIVEMISEFSSAGALALQLTLGSGKESDTQFFDILKEDVLPDSR